MGDQTVRQTIQQAMDLSPQEQFLLEHHFHNLHRLGTGGGTINNVRSDRGAMQPDGSYSTIRQMVVGGPDGRFYNIPTIWNGRQLSGEQAVNMAAKVGWNKWPAYATPDEADARYMKMHEFMDVDPPPAQVGPQ